MATQASIMRHARLTGLLYLSMMPLAMWSLMTRFKVFVAEDAAATFNNIQQAQGQFLGAIATWLTSQTISIFLVLALYKLLKPVNRDKALLMLVLALTGVPITMANELNQFAALLLVKDASAFAAFDSQQLAGQVLFFLQLHDCGLHISHIFWGLWLLPLGCLVFKSGFLPRFLGVFLLIAGVGYLVDLAIYFLLPDVSFAVTQFTAIGELLLPLWLVIKGVNVDRWNERASGAASSNVTAQGMV
jgi:hypothetical protein